MLRIVYLQVWSRNYSDLCSLEIQPFKAKYRRQRPRSIRDWAVQFHRWIFSIFYFQELTLHALALPHSWRIYGAEGQVAHSAHLHFILN
jgi:hypothetical protein